MNLPALALFERSLRTEARSKSYLAARIVLLAIILFALFPIQQIARFGYMGSPGLNFFRTLTYINFFFISLAGLGYFASAITEEKEEMMLGLLRMTKLNAISILLGKSTSRLWGALLALVAQVPFAMLAVTLGGISTRQVLAVTATLLAFVFLLCNLALLFSVMFRRTVLAAAFTAIVLISYLIFPPMVSDIMSSGLPKWQPSETAMQVKMVCDWLTATSPFVRLSEILTTGFAGPVVGLQVISNVVAGVVWFLLAWAGFERFTREQREEVPVRALWLRRRSKQTLIPPGVRDGAVLTWKDFNFMQGGRIGLLVRFVAIGAVIGMIFAIFPKSAREMESLGVLTCIVSLVAIAVTLAVDASRVFKVEVRWKTLSSVMMLPMSVSELAYRKVLGCLIAQIPALVYLAAGLVMVLDGLVKLLGEIVKEPMGMMGIGLAVAQYVLFLHLVAFMSLLVKRGGLALAFAIQYVAGGFLWMPFMLIAGIVFRGSDGMAVGMIFGAGVTVVVTLVLHRAIGRRLMRAAAQE